MSAIDYPVFYDRAVAVQRHAQQRRLLISRIISLVISVGISFAIWWFFRDQLGGLWWILLVGLVLPVGQLVRTLVNLRRAKQELTTVHDGFVLGFGREGLQVEDAFLPWDAVGRLAAVPARGRRDRLVVEAAGAPPHSVPLDYLTVMPATLDAGVRALSGGRCHVDFTALDL